MQRKNLSALKGKTIRAIVWDNSGNAFDFKDSKGVVLFKVKYDAIFDGDGNYFEDDIPSS